MGLTGKETDLVFVSDQEIRLYNKKYLRHDRTTDVIAFPINENHCWGEIVISLDTAARQATEQNHSLLKEIKILSIHGLLHLLGYEDHSPKELKRMWKKTEELLQKIEDV
ncbi:MAG: rRNA maturation RNase YbeY [Deltaproteobacteria bacterium]|nr:rRNA maturation RNase YbeY [Deltaproteobacteria bacterium]MBI2501552.1 rRNA maturation RNase YbeY [Deltaproteobacteria bacterium]